MKNIWSVLAILLSAVLLTVGFNLLLIPHQLITGGLSGIAMIIGYFTGLNIGMIYLVINIPVMIWGMMVIGRRFVLLSAISVFATSWFMQLIPERTITPDTILGSVFGAVLIGIATGLSLRAGGSTGGFDIIGSILTRNRDFPLGMVLFGLNGLVILALGYYKGDWSLALYSMLSMYITGKVMDMIHIRHIKVTAFIVTRNKEKLVQRLLQHRGVTLIKTEGAFSKQEHDMLMTVTTRYELAELKKIVLENDPKAFVNIVETVGIIGEFRRTN
ncbi:YitT family protein [Paenibacillus aurantius]|uniref:YitT family protein n=1 Tax=Paenibacillus aurantius TaxID=2918900 RepID=A0AA96LAQ8_9BACL|nr:YitT family protein [Paenibacillus aurantius]WNQ09750.1 YitT family protein [Paenibacillus aurantius]